MKKLLFIVFCIIFCAMKSDKPAYLLYNSNGELSKYSNLIKASEKADVVLFGEFHDNPICHWLELQITKDLYANKKQNLVLAAEMFEADNQLVIDEFLKGIIKASNFENESKLWNNYKTDYKPLIEFAKNNVLDFVASNVPRRYASLVASEGLESLSNKLDEKAKNFLPPLPIEVDVNLPNYKKMATMMGEHSANATNIVYAQALKDATMAYRISQHWKKGKTILHFNGSFHSDNFEGIVWYLKKYNPDLKVLTISSVQQIDVEKFEEKNKNLADFILCIPSDMTKTY
ncbi:MAG: iron-regulated protein [Bacteroidetes bacterium]|nr:MAG: iron-regulated protein [Bacteroidota bacterium]